jgi:hypothetical protein
MRFLLDEFIEVADDGCATEDAEKAAEKAVVTFQARAARVLLPGPQKGAFSLQQMMLRTLKPAAFQQLRRDVRDWLRSRVMFPGMASEKTLTLRFVRAPGWKWDRFQASLVDGSALDVFWFYLLHFIDRIGVSQIGVCHAPKSKRDPGQRNPELAGATERCERLFLRRGHAKAYCSERCRARVATQKSRKGKG